MGLFERPAQPGGADPEGRRHRPSQARDGAAVGGERRGPGERLVPATRARAAGARAGRGRRAPPRAARLCGARHRRGPQRRGRELRGAARGGGIRRGGPPGERADIRLRGQPRSGRVRGASARDRSRGRPTDGPTAVAGDRDGGTPACRRAAAARARRVRRRRGRAAHAGRAREPARARGCGAAPGSRGKRRADPSLPGGEVLPLIRPLYSQLMRMRVITAAVALWAACEAPNRGAPPGRQAGVRVVDVIPLSLSGETWQDAEPFLALYDSDPKLLAASAFTPNPGGSASATAPIFVSNDGGDSWTLRNTLPSEVMTADITHAVGGNPPVLYAGILKVPGVPLNELKTGDFLSAAKMTLQASRADIDQPFVRTTAIASADRVYVGLNDFDAPDGRTATVDVSLDGGATYTSRRIETRNTLGQNGPSIRPAVAQDHTVYVAYFGWRSQAGSG